MFAVTLLTKSRLGEKGLLTAHIIAQYSEALRPLTNTFTGTLSEQHREMNASLMKRNNEHLQLFQSFLRKRNPFSIKELQIGKAIQEQLTGKIVS